MYYVYILQSNKDHKLYVGYTADLKLRIKRHIAGQVISTRHRRPLSLVFYEAFSNRTDALAREKYLKSGYGKNQLHSMLSNTITKE